MSRFIQPSRHQQYLLPPSVDEWLPDNHLARFIVEVIDQLDLSGLVGRYWGCGSAAHHPAVLLALLVYGYATGTFSSRKIERATYDSVAFRFLSADTHPDPGELPGGTGGVVRSGAAPGAGDEAGKTRHHFAGRHQDQS